MRAPQRAGAASLSVIDTSGTWPHTGPRAKTVRPIADGLVALAGILLWIAYRRRRNPWDLVGAASCAVLLAWDLTMLPLIRVDVAWRELALLVAVVFAYWNVVGFPRAYVRFFKSGYRSREWDFDMRLYDQKDRLDQLLLEYRSSKDWNVYRRWRQKLLNRGGRILSDLRAMKAPTRDWADVRDGYVDLYGEILARVFRDEAPDDIETIRRGTELKERAEGLRIAYRLIAQRWMRGRERE